MSSSNPQQVKAGTFVGLSNGVSAKTKAEANKIRTTKGLASAVKFLQDLRAEAKSAKKAKPSTGEAKASKAKAKAKPSTGKASKAKASKAK